MIGVRRERSPARICRAASKPSMPPRRTSSSTAAKSWRAILDDPDDLASYAAYADWLAEQGAPRGEFMQVQLALEQEGRPARERARLKKREAELLAAHQAEWLGPLAPSLLSGEVAER